MRKKHNKQKKIFIGVSWPYANGNIHFGHLIGQYVVCDIFARFQRLKGNKVLMVSGTDCHGAPVELEAIKQNIPPHKLAEQNHELIKETYKNLSFLYDNYTTTMTENHKDVVQNVFKILEKNKYLFIKEQTQYYDTNVNRFLPDRYVKGTCPKCKTTNARGDECPECGEFLSPEDLLDPYSSLSENKPVKRKTRHYHMDLTRTSKELKRWIGLSSKNWRKWVKASTEGFIKAGLKPRSVTRDISFGIPVPIKGWEDKTIYVWIEAVVGYLSASIEWSSNRENPSEWEEFWKDPNCKHYYFVAGGNVPFHTIIWPAEIIAYNEKYKDKEQFGEFLLPNEKLSAPLNLPFNVPANKMLMYKGKKMSKGDKIGVTLEHLLEFYNPDLIRYFCTKYAPENHDREFVWKDFVDANNNELVANLGNLINRVLTFTQTRFDGIVPNGSLLEEVENAINKAFDQCSKDIDNCSFVKSIENILELGHFGNKFFNDQAPWEEIKENKTHAENTIYNSIQIVNAIRILLKPFIPESAKKIKEILNIQEEYDPNEELAESGDISSDINNWIFSEIFPGHKLNEPKIIFEKIEYSKELKALDETNVKESNVVKGKDINLFVDENLKDIPVIWKSFNNLEVKRKNPKVKKWVNELMEKTQKRYSEENWRKKDVFTKYIELHKSYSNTKDVVSSSQTLVESIKEKGKIPNINTLVDIYNAVSALTGVSIGVHDLSEIKGDVRLEILEKDQLIKTIRKKDRIFAKKGEYAYLDEQGIICRLDIKQSDRTKISNKTTNAFVIMQGHQALGNEALEKAMGLLEEGLALITKKS
jgi:methionyl-tRNA synthetase